MTTYKTISGHESAYLIGDDGSVKNKITNKILKPVKGKGGYYHVTLCYGKKEDCLVHRLVAIAFIKNPNNLPCVNHKDENKENNCVDNLEWCDHKYNLNYGKMKQIRNTQIIQKDKEGKFVKVWNSMKEASERLNIKYQGISRVCRKQRKTCGGYIWEYAKRKAVQHGEVQKQENHS